MWTIYKHIFPNGKLYIGQTKVSLNKRFKYGEGYKGCPLIYRAIKKYGWDSITTEIIQNNISSSEEANMLEEYYINYYDSRNPTKGYNLAPGGGVVNKINEEQEKQIYAEWDNNLGVVEIANKLGIDRNTVSHYLERYGISKEMRLQRAKDSRSRAHRKFDRKAIYEAWLNTPDYDILKKQFNCSEDTVRRALEEYQVPVQERYAIAQNKLRFVPNGNNRKSIAQYDLQNNYIQTFNSIAEANRALNKSPKASCIVAACKGNRKTAYGYKWKYINTD